jgi:hypothetical protein
MTTPNPLHERAELERRHGAAGFVLDEIGQTMVKITKNEKIPWCIRFAPWRPLKTNGKRTLIRTTQRTMIFLKKYQSAQHQVVHCTFPPLEDNWILVVGQDTSTNLKLKKIHVCGVSAKVLNIGMGSKTGLH